jgi:Archaeal/vacuolar-type H+-ATPase subunit I
MIVPMRKAAILVMARDSEETVASLRSMGVMQVEHQNIPDIRDHSDLMERRASVDAALEILQRRMPPPERRPPPHRLPDDEGVVIRRILELDSLLEQGETLSLQILDQIRRWENWGDLDPEQIRHLRTHGVYLTLHEVPPSETGTFPPDVVVRVVHTSHTTAYCVALSRRPFECRYPEIPPPAESLSRLRERQEENARDAEALKKELQQHLAYQGELEGRRGALDKEVEFREVLSGMGKEGAIRYLTGYIPVDREGDLIAMARTRRWGVRISEPSPGDSVPTLLRNPRWVRLITPVLDFLGLMPGYRELDVSVPFLIFFSIFFGILIGDAGYGFAYILITLALALWLKKEGRLDTGKKTIVSLFVVLSSCAVVWGILTGTFFGQNWLLDRGFQPLLPQLNDSAFLQSFCFFLGALHLSLAHSWRAILKFPSLKALADVGYICILWTAYFLANTLILGEAFPSFGIELVAIGVGLVILFTNPQARVLRGIGEGIGTILMSFMNNITDVISYVRLFAVGLACLAIAETANTMATQASGLATGIVALLIGSVVLVVGHGLNLLLGPIGVLVHGVRLNVLEFSGHANVTWSGMVFNPLKD